MCGSDYQNEYLDVGTRRKSHVFLKIFWRGLHTHLNVPIGGANLLQLTSTKIGTKYHLTY